MKLSSTLLPLLLALGACSSQPASRSSFPATTPGPASETIQHARPPRARPTTAPGFDFYLLTLSWSPEYCHSHANAPECAQHLAFVLHGLWPQNSNGTYPEHCSDAPGPSDPAQYADIYPDAGLLKHEWSTHGTCSALAPDAFFQEARQAFHAIVVPPTFTSLKQQVSLSPAKITALFTASNPTIAPNALAISCGNNFLTAVEVCLDKNLHPMACPAVRSCAANTVRIPAP